MSHMTLIGTNKVRVSSEGVTDFNVTWPCSELRDTRSYWFEFDLKTDELIDTDVPEQDDGAAARALAGDCYTWLFYNTK